MAQQQSSTREEPPPMRRTQSVYIRPDYQVGAMSWRQRVQSNIANLFSRTTDQDEAPTRGDPEWQRSSPTLLNQPVQYRLEATVRNKTPLWKRILTCGGFCGSILPSKNAGTNPNQSLAMYMHWMFRVSFGVLFLLMCAMFFILVIIFTAFIAAAGGYDEQCVTVGGEPFNDQGTAFADAFSLSWTTFSTVGYGTTYPALGFQNDSPTNCFFVNFICSLEALIGVIYASFCGAILFGKVLRIQSQAQVLFSDPIVIRYGTGLKSGTDDSDGEDEDKDDSEYNPCPVLEFRVVNRLFNEPGGEIMDATLNVVANVDAADSDMSTLSKGLSSTALSNIDSENDSVGGSSSGTGRTSTSIVSKLLDPLKSLGGTRQTLEEDPASLVTTKHVFSKMTVETGDHPFFKRVWLARHVLDENSPIVKPSVRRQIRKRGGSWPKRLNSYAAIRDSLKFNQILVSLNGISNVSASEVYAQKIYDFVDIVVGYGFVNILYRDSDGSLGVDTNLINDVCEQNGGGGEPLIMEEED